MFAKVLKLGVFAFIFINASLSSASVFANESADSQQSAPNAPTSSNGPYPDFNGDDPCGPPTDICPLALPPDASAAELQPSTTVGNPISLITGNKYQYELDYKVSGSVLEFSRHYNSGRTDSNSGVGRGWNASYGSRIARLEEGGFLINESTGRTLTFDIVDETEIGESRYRSASPANGVVWEENGTIYWSLPDGRKLTFQGAFLVHIDYPGHQYLSLYYSNRRLSEITDEAGRILKLEYTPGVTSLSEFEVNQFKAMPGHLKKLTLPDGTAIQYDYDNHLNLSRVRYADGTAKVFHYENDVYPNHLTGITDRLGNRFASWTYNENGYAVSSEHGDGVERVTLEYEMPLNAGDAGVTRVTNSLGDVSVYRWQRIHPSGETLLLSSEGPGCVTCPEADMRYSYTDNYQLSTSRDQAGTERQYFYDDQGRLERVERISAFGAKSTLERRQEYDEQGVMPVRLYRPSVNPDGEHEVAITYNDERLPIEVTESGFSPRFNTKTATEDTQVFEPVSRTTRFKYESGLIREIDGPREDVDDVTYFNYDQLGRLASMAMPSGESVVISQYDEHGRAIVFRHGANPEVSVDYDSNGNIVSISRLGQRVEYRYNAENRLTQVSNPDGKITTLSYDEAQRLTRVQDDLGRTTDLTFSTESQITNRTFYGVNGGLIKSLSFVFDAQGRMQSATEEKANFSEGGTFSKTVEIYYDDAGQINAIRNNASGAQRQYNFNSMGRMLETIEPNGLSIAREYDVHDRLVSSTDKRLNTTRYYRDDFGQVRRLHSPDTGVTDYEYDSAGNRIEKRDAIGNVTRYRWDGANRLIEQQDNDGLTRYQYHESNGRLVSASNPHSDDLYTYTALSQLETHTRKIDGHTLTTEYVYEGNGRLRNKILPDGQSLRYHYHESGPNTGTLRAITREALFGLSQSPLVSEIDLDNRDGQTSFLSHNGRRNEYGYNPDGTVASVSVTDALTLEYDYDRRGNIVGISNAGFEQRYGYKAGQLSEASTRHGQYNYEYDVAGNRISASASGGEQEYATNLRYSSASEGNHLQGYLDALTGETREYRYNDAGSPLRIGSLRYEYNANQRPVKVSRGKQIIAEYAYNSFGERIKKVTYAQNQKKVTYFIYDGSTLTAEIDADTLAYRQTVYLNHTPVVHLVGNAAYAVHTDHLGTPKLLTNDASSIVWQAAHTPLGQALIEKDDIRFNLRLPGQYADAETGTHYNYLRDYDPHTGRYLTSDPVGLEGGDNTYAYASNNVLGAIDVLGLSSQIAGMSIAPATAQTHNPFTLRSGSIAVPNPGNFEVIPLEHGITDVNQLITFFNARGAGCQSSQNVANFNTGVERILGDEGAHVLTPDAIQHLLWQGSLTNADDATLAIDAALNHLDVDENSTVLLVNECATDLEVRSAVISELGGLVHDSELDTIIASLGEPGLDGCRPAQFINLTELHTAVLTRFQVALMLDPELVAAEELMNAAADAYQKFMDEFEGLFSCGSENDFDLSTQNGQLCTQERDLRNAMTSAANAYADKMDEVYDRMVDQGLMPPYDLREKEWERRQEIMLMVVGLVIPLSLSDLALDLGLTIVSKMKKLGELTFALSRAGLRSKILSASAELRTLVATRVESFRMLTYYPDIRNMNFREASSIRQNYGDDVLDALDADMGLNPGLRDAIRADPAVIDTWKFLDDAGVAGVSRTDPATLERLTDDFRANPDLQDALAADDKLLEQWNKIEGDFPDARQDISTLEMMKALDADNGMQTGSPALSRAKAVDTNGQPITSDRTFENIGPGDPGRPLSDHNASLSGIEKNGDTFTIVDTDTYIERVKFYYERNNMVLHPDTEALIRNKITDNPTIDNAASAPGLHAEIVALNDVYIQAGGRANVQSVNLATIKPGGDSFPACTNCGSIAGGDPNVNILTGEVD